MVNWSDLKISKGTIDELRVYLCVKFRSCKYRNFSAMREQLHLRKKNKNIKDIPKVKKNNKRF